MTTENDTGRDGPVAAAGTGLFDGVLTRGRIAEHTSDGAWLQAMLDAEAALARAQADVGLTPPEHADAIAAACRAESYDVAALGQAAAGSGNPIVPLVRELTRAVADSGADDASGQVHRGATSQDILDTAAMLLARRGIAVIVADVGAAVDAAAALAEEHAATPIVGRTLLQQAVPTTFGLKAAGWLTGLEAAVGRLSSLQLPAQLGGAAGTLESLGEHGEEVLAAYAARLGLVEPVLPWHTIRTPIAELAGALGQAAVAAGKPAHDVVLLAQTEVAEVRSGSGGSSTMPHKRNPVSAIAASAGAARTPGLVSTLLAAGAQQEHERAAGGWHAEWRTLTDLLRTVGSAACWLAECLTSLEVDPAAMRANLERDGELLVSERATTALTPSLGRLAAHDLVTRSVRQADERPLHDVLAAAPEVDMSAAELAAVLDPTRGLESARALVRRALAHRTARKDGSNG